MPSMEERLDIIARYHEIKPLYDLVIQQFKTELLEDADRKDIREALPNGAMFICKKKGEYVRKTFNQSKLKSDNPGLYSEYVEEKLIPASVIVEVDYPDDDE